MSTHSMQVLHVTHRYPPRVGGVERHVKALATRQRAAGHDVCVVTADPNEADGDRPNSVPVMRCRSLAPGGAFYLSPSVYPAVRRHDASADVIHIHNYHAFPFVLGAFATRDAALVATPHYHGQSASEFRDRLLRLYRPLGRRALERADAIVAVSEWERKILSRDLVDRVTVVRNGIDVDRFAGAPAERRDGPYLLMVGRLEQYKRVDLAVAALTELPSYHLVVAGRGPDRDRLVSRATDAGVADRLDLLGYVDDERLPGLYAGAAAHLALSEHEAYGLTVGEALAAGTPSVVREVGGLSEWADRRDCIATAASPAAIAEAVDAAVGLDAPSAPIQSWDDCAEGVAAVYERATTS
ncbi:glycosyltransferase family 4 protein [Haloarcula brevis]|uniref:glycosyltransferase family 4 protein n=1 Tax=Haloarcula brevis TaxID=3111453 RepID=UPI00300EBA0C